VRAPDGELLEPCAGVHVAEVGPDTIEISILGLDGDVYRRHFAAHVRAYDERFKRNK
jgi:hypothetical protein